MPYRADMGLEFQVSSFVCENEMKCMNVDFFLDKQGMLA
jgi:hypothetical protein